MRRSGPPPDCGVRFTIPPPPGARFSPLQIPAVSPDGSGVAVTAIGADGITRLWVHSFRRAVARLLPGTEGASFPFWSPDGGSLGFFANDRLKRIEMPSGTIHLLADAKEGRGASWNGWGIVFSAASGAASRAIFSLPASGGAVQQRTNLANDPDEGHFWPAFLPDGEHFVYLHPPEGRDGRPFWDRSAPTNRSPSPAVALRSRPPAGMRSCSPARTRSSNTDSTRSCWSPTAPRTWSRRPWPGARPDWRRLARRRTGPRSSHQLRIRDRLARRGRKRSRRDPRSRLFPSASLTFGRGDSGVYRPGLARERRRPLLRV